VGFISLYFSLHTALTRYPHNSGWSPLLSVDRTYRGELESGGIAIPDSKPDFISRCEKMCACETCVCDAESRRRRAARSVASLAESAAARSPVGMLGGWLRINRAGRAYKGQLHHLQDWTTRTTFTGTST